MIMRLIVFISLLPLLSFSQKVFVDNSQVSFFSSAPLENISAISNKLDGVVNLETGDFFFRIPTNTFIFPSSLMQKHFNEKYIESEKYNLSSFKGNFKEKVSILQDGLINVSAKGTLNLHGVDQDIIVNTHLNIKNQVVVFYSEFNVVLKNYKMRRYFV